MDVGNVDRINQLMQAGEWPQGDDHKLGVAVLADFMEWAEWWGLDYDSIAAEAREVVEGRR